MNKKILRDPNGPLPLGLLLVLTYTSQLPLVRDSESLSHGNNALRVIILVYIFWPVY